MDELLKEILELQEQGEQMLEYANTTIEEQLATDVINAAEELRDTYISYKKAEQKHNDAVKKRNNYNELINNIN